MPARYEVGKPFTVAIDSPATVELPPRIRHGRLVGMLFDSGKTFLLPGAMRGIRELKKYYDGHPGLTVLVVGHTDATGRASENVALSKERAEVIAAFLKDDVDAWGDHYRPGKPGLVWGALEDQHMLATVAGYGGNIDGKMGPRSAEAVRALQREAGVGETGRMDAATRRALVTKYMQQDDTTLPAGVAITTHGCGSSFPEADGDRDEDRRRNRRVEIFLCDGPIEPPPGAPDGPEYREWVKRASETVDFADAPEDLVEVELEWPAELIERLPDLVLRISGPNVTARELGRDAATRDGDMMRFEFRFIDKTKQVDLEATAGGKTVTLWSAQLPGDLETQTEWRGRLEELLDGGDDDFEAPVEAVGGGDRFAEDVGWRELRALQRKGE